MAEFVKIDDRALAAAYARGRSYYAGPAAVSARFDRDIAKVLVELDTGDHLSLDPESLRGLRGASADDLADVIVDGAGFTLSFPRLDADFGVPHLLETFGIRVGPIGTSGS